MIDIPQLYIRSESLYKNIAAGTSEKSCRREHVVVCSYWTQSPMCNDGNCMAFI